MATITVADLRARLTNDPDHGLPSNAFWGMNLSAENWVGARLSCLSLRGAVLEGADLRGAHFTQVDLTGASLRGANLEQTTFQQVSAMQASFAEARCGDSMWSFVDGTAADFTRARLPRALWRDSRFERANFTGVDLSGIRLIDSTCTGAWFQQSNWADANTSGTRFVRAEFEGAQRFFACREIVVEILGREVGDDLERAKLVGALALHENWCYPDWAEILARQPQYRQAAEAVFRRYPRSGFLEALRAANPSKQTSNQ